MYLVLGYLAAAIAGGAGQGKNASSQGALDELVHQPAGSALVGMLAAGFAAYAAWRLLQAAAGDTGEEEGTELVKRVGWAGIAAVYVALAVRAALLLSGRGSSSNSAFSASRTLLDIGGSPLLAIVGVGVALGGLGLAGWGIAGRLGARLERGRTPRILVGTSSVLGTFGNAVRGLAFAGIGTSLVAAALSGSAKEAKGLNGSLHTLVAQPLGPALLAVAAAGFVAFGLASLVEAIYRDVDGNVHR